MNFYFKFYHERDDVGITRWRDDASPWMPRWFLSTQHLLDNLRAALLHKET